MLALLAHNVTMLLYNLKAHNGFYDCAFYSCEASRLSLLWRPCMLLCNMICRNGPMWMLDVGNKAIIMGKGKGGVDSELLSWKRCLSINKWTGKQRLNNKKEGGKWRRDCGGQLLYWKYKTWPKVCGQSSIITVSDGGTPHLETMGINLQREQPPFL